MSHWTEINLIVKMFPIIVGSVYRVKWFTTDSRNCHLGSKCFANDEYVLRLGFRRIGKAMVQVYQCWWRICREINVCSRMECLMFYVLYPFVLYLLALSRMCGDA
jgi:hypothetical protein